MKSEWLVMTYMTKSLFKLVNDAVVKSSIAANKSHAFRKQQIKLAKMSMYQCDDVVIEDHPEYDNGK
jgi:hypothetical protein